MNIYEKLFAVQQKLKVPKGQYSDFGNYKYRSCEDILNAVKPHLDEVKAIIVLSDDVQLIGDWHYIRATATMIDIENLEYERICEKLGFIPGEYVPDGPWTEDDNWVNPVSVLTLEELDYLYDNGYLDF